MLALIKSKMDFHGMHMENTDKNEKFKFQNGVL